MPCWTVKTMMLELQAADLSLLADAIEAELGVRVQRCATELRFTHPARGYVVRVGGGTIALAAGDEELASRLRVAYAKAAVRKAASRFRWQVAETSERRLCVSRRF